MKATPKTTIISLLKLPGALKMIKNGTTNL